ncbi:MAG: glycoside hydrolase family 97 catalytic domain-containing protein [Myroides sp.]|nr:glycoside hydrolase family 97 catalytic domain-containing protein [Myroides sp.]
MKNKVILLSSMFISSLSFGQTVDIVSPDGNTIVYINMDSQGKPTYKITHNTQLLLEESPLGLITNISDFSERMMLIDTKVDKISKEYTERRIKKSTIYYEATQWIGTMHNENNETIKIVFRVGNYDVAYRYELVQHGETAQCIILEEKSGFKFPSFTTTFLTPQATPMIGWMRTKPSYEEEYISDDTLGKPSRYGVGYTFPALFHVGDRGWVLLSETGVNSLYCGSKLSEGTAEGLYSIAFPEEGENNGIGSVHPAVSLPGFTPWRTITLGNNLKPIVETTLPWDLVAPLYEPAIDYQFGRSTWSWLEWQDASINYDDQRTFVDLSASLGYEFVLVDGWWDSNIGKDQIKALADYAHSKNVGLCLWYNSNGFWNDAPQTPKNKMNTSIARKQEMAWLKSIGIKGIKVDFFGGDKQETMKLYEDILSDANDYGLMVIFHGCTLPRGWERMYPNFAGSEAVLASENLIFTQYANDREAYNATLHPFIRNSVASMDFGPVLLNKYHSRDNYGGNQRKTTDVFQLATSVLFHAPIQNFGITPNNLNENPTFVIDFMRNVPTLWDETIYIGGYPGKYVVLARRYGNKWYIAGINAEQTEKKLTLELPMLKENNIAYYYDDKSGTPHLKNTYLKKQKITVTIQPRGGILLVQ